MAERARQRKRAKPTARTNGKAPRAGDNSGVIPGEVIRRHWALTSVAEKAVKAAQDVLKKKKSALSNCHKAAKGDGINLDSFKIARALDAGSHVEAVVEYAEVGHILSEVESPLHTQFKLFANIERPEPVNAYLRGQQDGRNGTKAEDNPFTPGSEEFLAYAEGWENGQGSLREGIGASA